KHLAVHVLAERLVSAAATRGLTLHVPTEVDESPGRGIAGRVNGRRGAVGATGRLQERGYGGGRAQADTARGGRGGAGRAKILVGIDGELEGVIVMADHLRPGAD